MPAERILLLGHHKHLISKNQQIQHQSIQKQEEASDLKLEPLPESPPSMSRTESVSGGVSEQPSAIISASMLMMQVLLEVGSARVDAAVSGNETDDVEATIASKSSEVSPFTTNSHVTVSDQLAVDVSSGGARLDPSLSR